MTGGRKEDRRRLDGSWASEQKMSWTITHGGGLVRLLPARTRSPRERCFRAVRSRRGLADLCWTVFVRVEILGTFLLAEEAGGEGGP